MGHPFDQRKEAEVPATPEEIWAAIASGPGINSWFMGRTAGCSGTVCSTSSTCSSSRS
jgi:uncharacterized protein YndB with AHSA1/START domain